MLSHLESRLADVLGTRLGAPLAGRVFVAPGPVDTTQAALLVQVSRAEVIEEGFGSARRPEPVPGAADPRRVVRMLCTVRIEVRPADGGTRAQTLAGLDALLYELDGPQLRSADALTAPGDPGFLLDRLVPDTVTIRPDTGDTGELPAVTAQAVGWFWPPEAPGITGVEISEALLRTAHLPVDLQPQPLLVHAGGPTVRLTLTVGTSGTTRLTEDAPPTLLPYGDLVVALVDAGGRPGAGTLSGGAAGPGGSRLVPVSEGRASVDYQPPGSAVVDWLVVSLGRADTGSGPTAGMELARFPLEVTA